jgi:adenine-specific DNA-methyltransferase
VDRQLSPPEFRDAPFVAGQLPSTRYRGSKRRHARSIAAALAVNRPKYLYDAFGGSGVVSALADQMGINSHYSDIFRWTTKCARVLLVNDYDQSEMQAVLEKVDAAILSAPSGFISNTFRGIYFTQEENAELDGVLELLHGESNRRFHDLVFYGVAQAALAKLPMSMFHRACLKQRLTEVDRRGGNLSTWNTPFRVLAPRFIREAVMFTWSRRMTHVVIQRSATDSVPELHSDDALFLDPPYVSPDGHAPTYAEAYHFLEGLASGEQKWRRGINPDRNHPVFSGGPRSEFETNEGWTRGMVSLIGAARRGSVLATARERDSPGARKLGQLLRTEFESVRRETIAESTIESSYSSRTEK